MIEVGDTVPNLGITVYDATGTLANGGAVTCTVTLPDLTTAVATVTNLGTGVYSAAYIATQQGHHLVTWVITGTNANTHSDSFDVESYPQGIISLAEAKKHLRVSRTDDDEMIRLCIAAASDACESSEGTDRIWRQRVITGETHTGGYYTIQLFHAPVLAVTAISSSDGTVFNLATDIDLSPDTGIIYATSGWWPYAGRVRNLSVTYAAGAKSIPPLVRDGVKEMTRHLYNISKGGTGLPAQSQPDYTSTLAYLIPYRVASAWRAHSASSVG